MLTRQVYGFIASIGFSTGYRYNIVQTVYFIISCFSLCLPAIEVMLDYLLALLLSAYLVISNYIDPGDEPCALVVQHFFFQSNLISVPINTFKHIFSTVYCKFQIEISRN